MLISFLRTIIMYLTIVVALRIMGKRQVGQLEPAELVITMLISDLAAIPIGHVSIPLMHGIIPVVTLIILEAFISFINLKSRKFRKWISGTPVVLIRNGKVFEKELESLRLNIDDLMEELRSNGCADVTEIAYAIFETNGSLSIILKATEQPLTPQDIGMNSKYKGLPFMFICDGKINEKALSMYQKDDKWLNKKLSSEGIGSIKEVFFAGVDEKGKFFVQTREAK